MFGFTATKGRDAHDREPRRLQATTDSGLAASRRVIEAVFGPAAARGFDVRYWDGTLERSEESEPAFTLVIQRRGALRRMFLPPSEISFVEAYISSDIDIEGDLEAAVHLSEQLRSRILGFRALAALFPKVIALPRDEGAPDVRSSRFAKATNLLEPTRHSDAAEIRYHYDVGNDFYALWLDERMLYTCAYFRTGVEDITTAQLHKLEHICRKLRLKPGDRLLDIGCGWGGLVRHAVKHHGVTALGVTLSAAQAEWAQRKIAEQGLSDRCRVEVRDYRDLDPNTSFDKIVSVGVTEHVAKEEQPDYFRAAYAMLEPGGLFLNHCEVSNERARPHSLMQRLFDKLWRRREFIARYVFPDGALVPIAHVIASAEGVGFEVRDVESLREHYAVTLRHWVRALEANKEQAVALVGERIYRVWRLYMAGAAEGFQFGALGLAQTLLAKARATGEAGVPWSREDIYAKPYPSADSANTSVASAA